MQLTIARWSMFWGMRSMESVFDKAERDVEAYRHDANATWDEVKQQHDRAMVVCDVEDVVGLGIYVMELWFRRVEHWHEWVSEDEARFDAGIHKKLKDIESTLIEATQTAVNLIGAVKKWGYEIDGEDEFREVADRLLGHAPPADGVAMDDRLRALEQGALDQFKSGSLKEVEHWGK